MSMKKQEQLLDCSSITSKLNQISTMADENSYHSIEPIHSFSQSFLSPIKYKRSPPKPAFGTSSIRQIKQLEGNKMTDIVAYSRINYEKNQKYKDRYQQIQPKLTPFLTTSARFSNNKKLNPGPGAYKFPQIFKNDEEPKKNHSAMFCPFKRWQVKERKLTGKSYEIEKEVVFSPNKQNLQSIDKSLQQKIKQKREEMKQKMLKLKELMKKPQIQTKTDLTRMGYSVDTKNTEQNKLINNEDKIEDRKTYFVPKNLKQITTKYIPKNEYNFEKEEYRSGSEMKNFTEKYNNQPVFLKGSQNLYSSYINSSQTPGPGYYEKRTKKLPIKDFSRCKQFFL